MYGGLGFKGPKYPTVYMVECRASALGITILIWGSIPRNSTWYPLENSSALLGLVCEV